MTCFYVTMVLGVDINVIFRNDYGQGCIPEIMEYMDTTNGRSFTGYGMDEICQNAKEAIKNIFQIMMSMFTFSWRHHHQPNNHQSMFKTI